MVVSLHPHLWASKLSGSFCHVAEKVMYMASSIKHVDIDGFKMEAQVLAYSVFQRAEAWKTGLGAGSRDSLKAVMEL